MNAALAQLFPPAVVIVQEVVQMDAEARHRTVILATAELHDVSLEDLSPENIQLMLDVMATIRSQLLQCQAAGVNTPEAQPG